MPLSLGHYVRISCLVDQQYQVVEYVAVAQRRSVRQGLKDVVLYLDVLLDVLLRLLQLS
ncbi:MAG: hypothetical protein JWP34_4630 [Massilia sp.]|nr:hypothetical protein [Massilia sp.]